MKGMLSPVPLPVVFEVKGNSSIEVRLELTDNKDKATGVYDLPTEHQEALLLKGHLPQWGMFLPDFIIVLATNSESTSLKDTPADLRVHVGGAQWEAVQRGTPFASTALAACDYHGVKSLLSGTHSQDPAPMWLLGLIDVYTPWGHLLG